MGVIHPDCLPGNQDTNPLTGNADAKKQPHRYLVKFLKTINIFITFCYICNTTNQQPLSPYTNPMAASPSHIP